MNSDPVAPFDGLKVWMKDIFLIRWSIQRVESGLLVKFNVFYQCILEGRLECDSMREYFGLPREV